MYLTAASRPQMITMECDRGSMPSKPDTQLLSAGEQPTMSAMRHWLFQQHRRRRVHSSHIDRLCRGNGLRVCRLPHWVQHELLWYSAVMHEEHDT